jgi:hypothetical protein
VNRRSALYPAIPPKIRQHGGSPARTKKAALRCDAGNPMWNTRQPYVKTLAEVCGLADHIGPKTEDPRPLDWISNPAVHDVLSCGGERVSRSLASDGTRFGGLGFS